MAIIGLGTDIVEISRIEQSLLRTPGLVKRVLTAAEQQRFADHALASRSTRRPTRLPDYLPLRKPPPKHWVPALAAACHFSILKSVTTSMAGRNCSSVVLRQSWQQG